MVQIEKALQGAEEIFMETAEEDRDREVPDASEGGGRASEMNGLYGVPFPVAMAFRFAMECQQFWAKRAVAGANGEFRLFRNDLHPAQEGCYRLALTCLGRYFNSYPGKSATQ